MSRREDEHSQWTRLRAQAFAAPWLSAERENELLQLAQRGDRAAVQELYVSHLRLVVDMASRYRRPGVQPDDLVSEGSLGLLEAIRRFDSTRETRLSTYAKWWISAHMRAYLNRNRSLVPLPKTRGVRTACARLANAERLLIHELGRMPTTSELAVSLEVPEADVLAVSASFASCNLSLSEPMGERLELREEAPGPEDVMANEEASRQLSLRVQSALAAMGERDRMIVRSHFLQEEGTSMVELGTTLGITRQRVSQIAKRVRRQLARELSGVAC